MYTASRWCGIKIIRYAKPFTNKVKGYFQKSFIKNLTSSTKPAKLYIQNKSSPLAIGAGY